MKVLYFFLFSSLLNFAFALDLTPSGEGISSDQVISNLIKKKNELIPGDNVIPTLTRNIDEREVAKSLGISSEDLKNIMNVHEVYKKEISGKEKKIEPVKLANKIDVVTIKRSAPKRKIYKKRKQKVSFKRSTIQVFDNFNNDELVETITIPSGSKVLGTLQAGVEVSNEKEIVDVRLDYAFLGPNGAVVELTDCFMWLEVYGNYNKERILGKSDSISCRITDGKTFEIPVFAQLRDKKDEYIGMKAELLTRGKVAASALMFLQNGSKLFGEAMAAAQVTTEVVSGGTNTVPERGQNITGNNSKYIAGQAITGATGDFLQWWIDYYQSLSPTLAMEPGRKVFLAIKGEVQIPKIFFKGEIRSNTNDTLTIYREKDVE